MTLYYWIFTALALLIDRDVTVTYYNIVGKTATGEMTTEIAEPFVAVSRDLLDEYPFGTYVLIFDCAWEGAYVVKDKMGAKHTNSFDVFTLTPHAKTEKCKCRKIQ